MNTIWLKLFSCFALFGVIFAGHSAEVEVNWENASKYTDIRASNGTQKQFKKRVFNQLEAHFAQLAQSLPEQQVLKIKVTNVDLAGDVKYMVGPNNATIRVLDDLHFPRISFQYQLLDSQDAVIKSGEEHLKDMNYLNNNFRAKTRASFVDEKRMLDEWFKKTFIQSH
ncbi:DUF3016 domain-containing protein [Thalassotalea aquiviva]|uniref:DUF3016 domain-containing protein n=1 Tax=Thalassotalea aquiviva TaxID=3242415 RepID=UPI003529D662